MKLEFKKLHPCAIIPKYAHSTDAAMDIFTPTAITLHPHKVTKVSMGIAIHTTPGTAYIAKDKSSVASKGVITLGGVFDAGYQGEVTLIMLNLTDEDIFFPVGSKLAQLVFINVLQPELVQVEEFSTETVRGVGGFGSTGA